MIFQVSYFPCCREPGKCWLPGPFWVCCCFVSLFPTPMVSFVFQRWLTHVSARIHVLTEQTVSPRDLGRTCSFVLAPPSSFISKNGKRRQSSRGSGYFSHRVNYHTAGENVRLQRWMMRDWQVTSASQVRFTVRILHSWVVTSIWLRCIPFSNRYTDFVAVSIFKFIEMTLSPARCGVKSSLFQVWSCRRSPQRRLSKDSSLAYVLSNWWTLSANQSQKLCRTYSSEPATACSVAFIYLIQFHVCTSLARLPFPGSVSISDIGGISDKEAASSPQDLCCQAPSPLPPYFPILPLPLPGFDGKWKSAILPGNVTNCQIAVKFIVLHKVPHWRVLGIMWQQNQYTSCSGHCVHRGQQMLLCTSNHLAL